MDKQVATRIDKELARRLAQVAKREERSESAILRRALREHLAKETA